MTKDKEQMFSRFKIKVSWEIGISNEFLNMGIGSLRKEIVDITTPNFFAAFYNFSIGIERLQKVLLISTMKVEENCKVFDAIVNKFASQTTKKELFNWIDKNKKELSKHCIMNYNEIKKENQPKIDVCINNIFDVLYSFSKSHNLVELNDKIKIVKLTKKELEFLKLLSKFYKNSRYEHFELFDNQDNEIDVIFSDLIFDDDNSIKEKIISNILSISKKYYAEIKKDRWLGNPDGKYIFG
ncbi:MAG: hypothetical protein FWD89_04525 [Firmicutes bacterium]|nr:hypothetical protein [Bacillota bacterium]MCL2771548.1 hypothetical protein [Bacillota bacterium]